GSIPGLKHPEDDAHVINLSLKNCKPPLPIQETFIPVGQNRSVIQYEIAESNRKPHYYLTAEKMKETFVRVDDKSIKASREMREISRRAQRNKDIRFHYGDHEHWLMKYLQENRTITLKEFTERSG